MIVPKNRSMYRYAVDTFSDLLNQVQERSAAYRCNDIDVKCWNAFVEEFSQREGVTFTKGFIRDFAEYGIQSWFNPDISQEDRQRVRFSWIFSRKAIERWDALSAKVRKRCVRTCLKRDYDITNNVRPKLHGALISVRPVEERFKRAFYNTRKGLSWCIANTTLYNHRSGYCEGCNFKKECKDILQSNYIKIYKLRGYSETKRT